MLFKNKNVMPDAKFGKCEDNFVKNLSRVWLKFADWNWFMKFKPHKQFDLMSTEKSSLRSSTEFERKKIPKINWKLYKILLRTLIIK